jgi:hypothetical protein
LSSFKSYIFLNYFIINLEISDYFEEKIIAIIAMATIKVLLFIISDAEPPGATVVIMGKLLQSEGFSPYKIKNDCLVN